MPVPPHAPGRSPARPGAEVARVQRLIHEKQELVQRNRVLAETVQALEAQLRTKSPNDVTALTDANAALTAQVDELLQQMVAAEERVILAEEKCAEYEERVGCVARCRDTQVAQLEATIDDLREHLASAQAIHMDTRGERDAAQRQVAELRTVIAAHEEAEARLRRDAAHASDDHAAVVDDLRAQMDALVNAEVAKRTAKEEECARTALELEEANAALAEEREKVTDERRSTEELAKQYIALEQRLAATESAAAEKDAALRRDLREKDIALELIHEKLEVAQVECELLNRWKRDQEAAAAAERAAQERLANATATTTGTSILSPTASVHRSNGNGDARCQIASIISSGDPTEGVNDTVTPSTATGSSPAHAMAHVSYPASHHPDPILQAHILRTPPSLPTARSLSMGRPRSVSQMQQCGRGGSVGGAAAGHHYHHHHHHADHQSPTDDASCGTPQRGGLGNTMGLCPPTIDAHSRGVWGGDACTPYDPAVAEAAATDIADVAGPLFPRRRGSLESVVSVPVVRQHHHHHHRSRSRSPTPRGAEADTRTLSEVRADTLDALSRHAVDFDAMSEAYCSHLASRRAGTAGTAVGSTPTARDPAPHPYRHGSTTRTAVASTSSSRSPVECESRILADATGGGSPAPGIGDDDWSLLRMAVALDGPAAAGARSATTRPSVIPVAAEAGRVGAGMVLDDLISTATATATASTAASAAGRTPPAWDPCARRSGRASPAAGGADDVLRTSSGSGRGSTAPAEGSHKVRRAADDDDDDEVVDTSRLSALDDEVLRIATRWGLPPPATVASTSKSPARHRSSSTGSTGPIPQLTRFSDQRGGGGGAKASPRAGAAVRTAPAESVRSMRGYSSSPAPAAAARPVRAAPAASSTLSYLRGRYMA